MKLLPILHTAITVSLLMFIAGCPTVKMAYPVRTAIDTFGFEPKWNNKQVCFVQILTKDDSPEAKRFELPALIGPCCDIPMTDTNYLSPFNVVWAAKATKSVPVEDFFIVPGVIPNGFEQIIPNSFEKFIPIKGQQYYILVCLEPVEDRFYSLGTAWSPGQDIQDLLRDTKVIEADAPYRHIPSGMMFPVEVGSFKRGEIRHYVSEGLNVGVGYNLENPHRPIAATVYVYPMISTASPDNLRFNFEEAKRTISLLHKNAKLVKENPATLKQSGATYSGFMASFEYEDKFAGFYQPVTSHLYLFCDKNGKWEIKYRFTHPKDVDASQNIEEFMNNLILSTN